MLSCPLRWCMICTSLLTSSTSSRVLHSIPPSTLFHYYHYTPFLPKGKVRPANKLQLKAAHSPTPVGIPRSKQDPINRGHGAQYIASICPSYMSIWRQQQAGTYCAIQMEIECCCSTLQTLKIQDQMRVGGQLTRVCVWQWTCRPSLCQCSFQ